MGLYFRYPYLRALIIMYRLMVMFGQLYYCTHIHSHYKRRLCVPLKAVADEVPCSAEEGQTPAVSRPPHQTLASAGTSLYQTCLSLFVVVSVFHVRGRGLRIPARFSVQPR